MDSPTEREDHTDEVLEDANDLFLETFQEYNIDEEEESEESKSTFLKEHIQQRVKCQDTVLVKVVAVLDTIFSPKTMARLSILAFLLLVSSHLYSTVMEAWAKPTILKPRQSRPFFSNASSKYLTDYYSGNMRPEWILKKTDLLIVMYYSPWSTDSAAMRHPFEMVAKFMRKEHKVSFAAINCWASGSQCRSTYKLMNYPAVVAYSNTASLMYSGPYERDHLYRWAVRVQNPVAVVNSIEDIAHLQQKFHHVVIGYFPFKNMEPADGYKAFAAAGFMLTSGHPEDEQTIVCATHSLNLARTLNMRFEGDIQLHTATGSVIEWPARSRTAVNILDFIRKQRLGNGHVRYISSMKDHLSSEQFSNIVRESPVLILSTALEPIYGTQDEINVFSQVARDYWTCNQEMLREDFDPIQTNRRLTISEDSLACDSMNMAQSTVRKCCRSLFSSVDWNMACASSAKYRWEHEEAKEKKRNHWLEQVLPCTAQCDSLKTMAADALVEQCCLAYEEIAEPLKDNAQQILEEERLENGERALKAKCIRLKLAEHLGYNLNVTYDLYVQNWNNKTSTHGFGCEKNDSLQFAVLDNVQNKYFLQKWGVTEQNMTKLFIVDFSRELFVVMNDTFSQESMQKFIVDYHSHQVNDYMLDEKRSQTKFVPKKREVEMHKKQSKSQSINRLTRDSFLQMAENVNSTVDEIVFFSGGNWHAPSTSVLYVLHNLVRYMGTGKYITFNMIDTSRNELPYNFNFETVPSIVLFLAGRRDLSWKYPESLPITMPNLVSFILSRSSPLLRWKVALSKCDRFCLIRNVRRLRKYGHVIHRDLHNLLRSTSELSVKSSQLKELKISQLGALRSVLRVMSSSIARNGISNGLIDSLLSSQNFDILFQSFR